METSKGRESRKLKEILYLQLLIMRKSDDISELKWPQKLYFWREKVILQRNTYHQWRSQGEGVKFHPLSDPGGPFSIQSIKYCNLSLSTFFENKEGTCLRGVISDLQGLILSSRGHPRPYKGPSKVKWAEMTSFRFWERPTQPGALFMANFTPNAKVLAAPPNTIGMSLLGIG